ncbi:hypothetical protein [uncultured Microbacterium sp.]|uniref:hypothetical protein n=1 Tax=uncultured Microbacterium sp. TaxID=191216 RepID=UPI0025E60512|nr:hypothetical protein [uncultured Microbacterium sp.]
MTVSHYQRLQGLVIANPNAAEFLVEVDTLKRAGKAGDDLEDAIVNLAVKAITRVDGRS